MPPTAAAARAWTLPLVLIAWLAVPVPAAWFAWIIGASFFGEPPTPGQQALSLLLWTTCALAAALLPLVGAGSARTLGWRRTAFAFRVLAGAGALGVAALLLWLYA